MECGRFDRKLQGSNDQEDRLGGRGETWHRYGTLYCYVLTLTLERLLAHVARAGEDMGRPGAIPRSDGHIATRGEVLGPARPSSRLFRKGARNAYSCRSKQSHAACASDARTTLTSLPDAQTSCPQLPSVPGNHLRATRVLCASLRRLHGIVIVPVCVSLVRRTRM